MNELEIRKLQQFEKQVYTPILGMLPGMLRWQHKGEIGFSLMKSRSVERKIQCLRSVLEKRSEDQRVGNTLLSSIVEEMKIMRNYKWINGVNRLCTRNKFKPL